MVIQIKVERQIQFLPSLKYFKNLDYKEELIKKRLKELAFLNSGIRITLTNDINSKTYEYFYEGGIEQYINEVLKRKKRNT